MARKKSAVEEEAELNMTPMIDVTFQLLIFFIITLKFKTLEKKLLSYLPTDFGLNSSSEPIDENFAVIKLVQPTKKEAGANWRSAKLTRVYFNDQRVEGKSVVDCMKEVRQKLANFRKISPEARGKIHAELGVPHRHVVTTLDIFSREKYENVVFVGLTKNFNLTKSEAWWNNLQNQLGVTKTAGSDG